MCAHDDFLKTNYGRSRSALARWIKSVVSIICRLKVY